MLGDRMQRRIVVIEVVNIVDGIIDVVNIDDVEECHFWHSDAIGVGLVVLARRRGVCRRRRCALRLSERCIGRKPLQYFFSNMKKSIKGIFL